MDPHPAPLAPALYFVSTPIGSARDITLRALDILKSADVIAAEDTRNTRHLMEIHGISLGGRPLVAYHDHNGKAQRPRLIGYIKDGKSVAYVSDAGTPLVADPGYALGRAVIDAGLPVTAAPGPSAVLAALSVSGLPTDRFLFAGFPPPAAGARLSFLKELSKVPATLVFYESPNRLGKLLAAMVETLGGDRPAAICRELTKRFEETRRGTLDELVAALPEMTLKGEIVVLCGRPGETRADAEDVEAALRRAMETSRLKDAAREVAEALNLPRREVYQIGLTLKSPE
ncbi:16S rRNA (cytidine(1402)-2'-O)-methyltransferase [Brevirhabdus pacifica]|uniref:Ribosomal RNA small subunit methyltransferase I n=2 Tax=Brevirhabdus pacifica TaxID=1267768 RepID=A0A1U7DJS0_9RHOB|nr:16S rRNA (cytidine(1402)-2'-O)-methyltransferase [Brevirhabdus pacifica]APX90244.1 16S rRNA (cytidine(1402)-2'-O)-methyltransferase [Brevirhabdus pacifica]OWU78708.1 16S rRNA methyltransferase [Loktanella sp. 22II-4b]PJJ80682.1 16S rRNA (cytidine1402-2'-O)-methyltransferase [Brevirhabdus pacifica]